MDYLTAVSTFARPGTFAISDARLAAGLGTGKNEVVPLLTTEIEGERYGEACAGCRGVGPQFIPGLVPGLSFPIISP